VFKRLFWLLVGIALGLGTSFWVMRTVREKIERYSPERLSQDLTSAARGFGHDLRLALAEGREAMQKREAELRAELMRTPS
jgi:hypothetical protein